MKIENVKGIIWDLDGTLLNSFDILEQIIAEIVLESGHKMPTRDFMLRNYHGSLKESIKGMLRLNSIEEVDEIVALFLMKQKDHYSGDLESHLYKDATSLAQKAVKRGIQQLLITNREHEGTGNASPRYIIASTILADCISEIFPSDQIAYRKPDKRSIGDWMDRHNLTSSETIVIGDQFVDAQLALNIGSRVILIKRNSHIPHIEKIISKNQESMFVVDSLNIVELV